MNLDYLGQRQVIKCVCGASRSVRFRKKDRYKLSFEYAICIKCGHVRTRNPLSDSAAELFYQSSDYRSMYFPNQTPRAVYDRQSPRPNSSSALLRHAESLGLKGGTVIEYGCGGGWNLLPFRDAGWRTIGYDLDATYVELGRHVHSLDLRRTTSEADPIAAGETPNLIILYHVLEHSVDPMKLLMGLRKWCEPQTLVIVGIPLLERIRAWRWNEFFHIAHIHYFSRRTFSTCANRAGFRVLRDSNPKLFTLRIAESSAPDSDRFISLAVSTWSLIAGFLHPTYRIRQLGRHLLKSVGLLSVARKLKKAVRPK
jgi:2-polyprenyl-3-methyl-5-hydroxy-6-metoxy-1,4-benzoquinol methylase